VDISVNNPKNAGLGLRHTGAQLRLPKISSIAPRSAP
jgi:hypothetical protein